MASQGRLVLALVPARGGSVGVPRKNLRQVNGRSLLDYTLDAAFRSSFIDRTFLSSDDDELLAAGLERGAETIRRPAWAATDTSTATDVVAHFLGTLDPDTLAEDPIVAYLQPTSPLRTSQHIDSAFRLLEAKDASVVVSVLQLKRSPYKSLVKDERGLLQPIFGPSDTTANRQDLPAAYYPNGAIYLFRVSEFQNRKTFPCAGAEAFEMNDRDSLDIDTEEDFAALRAIMEV